jgi:RNA polymerase sigma-70 factor (ECF subfamily)
VDPTMAARFDTTHWSLVLAAADRRSPDAEAALAALCSAYWHPVYAFIRRTGHDEDSARDLTQGFFTLVLEKNYFGEARRERGRLRTFLLTAVRHFLSNERDRERALKRGGGAELVPLDEDESTRKPVDPVDERTPERLYERQWALAVLDQAMARLRRQYEQSDRADTFDQLKPLLTGRNPDTYAKVAGRLGTSDGALRVAVHRMRREFAVALRDTVAETVARPEDIDLELRQLLDGLRRE